MRAFPLFAVLLAMAGTALAVDDASLRQCREMKDPASRLACYDALPMASPKAASPVTAAPGRNAPSPAAVPEPPSREQQEAQFGLPEIRVEPEEIKSSIPGSFEGWGPNYRIRLANGQVWEVVDGSQRFTQLRD